MSEAIPSKEELAELTGTPVEEVEEILQDVTQMSEEDANEYREKVLSNPKKVAMIKKKLKNVNAGIDLKLALINQMFGEVEDESERQMKQDQMRAELIQEKTEIEIALFSLRQKGKKMRSKHYSFTPHVGLNRRQRRMFK